MAQYLQPAPDGTYLLVRLTPKAAKNSVGDEHAGRLKIFVTSPPVDGKANEHLVKFLAKVLKTGKGNIQIISGQSAREKKVLIKEQSPDEVAGKLKR